MTGASVLNPIRVQPPSWYFAAIPKMAPSLSFTMNNPGRYSMLMLALIWRGPRIAGTPAFAAKGAARQPSKEPWSM